MGNIGSRVGVGTGIVLRRDGHVLLGKRLGAHGEGLWALPGGKPDSGESPSDAIIRELAEETDIAIRYAHPLPVWTYDRYEDAGLHYVTLYFVANCPPDATPVVTEPDKCERWQWFSYREVPHITNLFDGVEQAVKLAQEVQ